MQLSWQILPLQLKETFSIAYGNYAFREALLVTLSYKNEKGYGECTAIDYYGIDLHQFSKILTSIKTLVENSKILYPTDFYLFLESLKIPSFLRSALDCAYWDLYGKLEQKSFIELNAIPTHKIPKSSITISIASVTEQLKKIENSTWDTFKVKCNKLDKKAVELFATSPYTIALDSNASFTIEDCHWLENQAFASNFTYVEQPIPVNQYSALNKTKYVHWMADEDCQNENNLLPLLLHYNSINIKLVKCGGLTPAISLLQKARQLGYTIMIGCMTESTVGISAGCALAPLADFCDLDGANLIAKDIAKGSVVKNGFLRLSEAPGLGIIRL